MQVRAYLITLLGDPELIFASFHGSVGVFCHDRLQICPGDILFLPKLTGFRRAGYWKRKAPAVITGINYSSCFASSVTKRENDMIGSFVYLFLPHPLCFPGEVENWLSCQCEGPQVTKEASYLMHIGMVAHASPPARPCHSHNEEWSTWMWWGVYSFIWRHKLKQLCYTMLPAKLFKALYKHCILSLPQQCSLESTNLTKPKSFMTMYQFCPNFPIRPVRKMEQLVTLSPYFICSLFFTGLSTPFPLIWGNVLSPCSIASRQVGCWKTRRQQPSLCHGFFTLLSTCNSGQGVALFSDLAIIFSQQVGKIRGKMLGLNTFLLVLKQQNVVKFSYLFIHF